MRLEITGRHVTVTPLIRRLVERKIAKLDRLLNDEAVSAQVVCAEVPRARRVDVTLHARGEHFLHSAAESATWDASITRAVERLSQQARKLKGRWQERKRSARVTTPPVASAGAAPPAAPRAAKPRVPTVLRTSRIVVKTMTVTAAVRAAEGAGDVPIVFRDAATAVLSILFRRANGELTLLEAAT